MPFSRNQRKDGRIPSLDGLRAISIGLVLVGHGFHTAHFPHNAVTAWLSQFSVFGVRVFFVISGFLITKLLLQEREKHGRIRLGAFYLRRTLRIFPAALVFITVMAVLVRPRFLVEAYTSTFCYIYDPNPWVLSHLWSLSVEEQFYLLWPPALALAFAARRQIGFAIVAAGPLVRLLVVHLTHSRGEKFFPCVADNLMVGCLLAMYYPTLQRRCAFLKRPAALLLMTAALLACQRLVWHEWYQIYFGAVQPVLMALMTFALVERADAILNNRVAQAAGVLSYSLYLWQQPFLNASMPHWWAAFPTNMVLALLCALLSYFLVERPFVNLYRSRKQQHSRQLVTES